MGFQNIMVVLGQDVNSSGLGKASVNTVKKKKGKTIESNDYLELLFC